MELSLIFDIISTTAVILGIVFGLLQLRQYQSSRKRESAIYLLNSFQTKAFIDGIWVIQSLPNGLSKQEIEKLVGDEIRLIGLVMSVWESVGILMFHNEIEIEMVDNAFSGPIHFSWQKLETYIRDLRQELQRDTLFEWFEWLEDRMQDRESKRSPVPANIAYRDWEP